MYPQMKKWARRLFMEALLGDKYVQGKGALRSIDVDSGAVLHCPLGVLCEELRCRFYPATYKDKEIEREARYVWRQEAAKARGSYIPDGLAKAINLSFPAQYAIANMNDDGKTFKEIAEWAKVNL